MNRSVWSSVEDAEIFHLHRTMGPKWTAIAGLLRRRNNNNVKNRFHHIRRRLEKDAAQLDATSLNSDLLVRLCTLKRLSNYIPPDGPDSDMDTIHALVRSIRKKKGLVNAPHDFQFELTPVSTDTGCRRCGLLVPSKQTGEMRCMKTGWCMSCVSAPTYLCSNLLRRVHCEVSAPDPFVGDVA